jgi:hypothetical protein
MANRVSKYLSNINKELGQTQKASEKAVKAKNDANIVKLPGGKKIKTGPSEKEANKTAKAERGQFFGAVLQGRRYDEKGKQLAKSTSTVKPRPKPKATAKPTPKATVKPKPMTASEKAFIKNQKEKAKATKRTGVYPNTAN